MTRSGGRDRTSGTLRIGTFATSATAQPAAAAETPATRYLGQILGRTYRILRRLDEGGMAVVLEAEHLRLRRNVAVKVLLRHLAGDEVVLARFRNEAEVVSRFNHPNIVNVIDFDTTDDGEPYLVMELLQGQTLEARLQRERPFPVAEAVRITTQIASGLGAAHSAAVVHRDLKPANVFLVPVAGQGQLVKLLDFGISKSGRGAERSTLEREILGTPSYMAPEQALGRAEEADHRADQFALAVIAYEMLAGKGPFEGDDVMSVIQRVVHEDPPRVSKVAAWVPSALDAPLRRALSKDPRDRFASIGAFAAALIGATTPSPTPRDVLAAAEQARLALEGGQLDNAVDYAESALRLAERSADKEAAAALASARPLLDRVFERRLGDLRRPLTVLRAPTSGDDLELSPQHAFLVSRLDGGLTIEEALDVAAMPRAEAVRLIAGLMRHKLVTAG